MERKGVRRDGEGEREVEEREGRDGGERERRKGGRRDGQEEMV